MKRGQLLKTTRGDVGLISVAHAARLLCHGPNRQLVYTADDDNGDFDGDATRAGGLASLIGRKRKCGRECPCGDTAAVSGGGQHPGRAALARTNDDRAGRGIFELLDPASDQRDVYRLAEVLR
jgi:hypothetical protein